MSVDVEQAAVDAFIAGWEATGAPVTDAVLAGMIAAGQLAETSSDPDEAVQATLQLGSLEGVWANVYRRRDHLYDTHIAAVTALWRDLVARIDLKDLVAAYRRRLGLAETNQDRDRDRDRAAIAAAAAIKALHALMADTSDPHLVAVIRAVLAALVDAQAEGEAGAVAVAAQQLGKVSIDFGLAFTDAHTALDNLGGYWDSAQGWVGRVLKGAATDLGRALATAARDELSADDMLSAAADAIGWGTTGDTVVPAVSTLVDMAMSQSFSRGALALYTREGVRQVDYVTAGDGRVCPQCKDYESRSPYSIVEAPVPGWHPYCRCNLSPTSPLDALGELARYT